jgi:hypothetical protein
MLETGRVMLNVNRNKSSAFSMETRSSKKRKQENGSDDVEYGSDDVEKSPLKKDLTEMDLTFLPSKSAAFKNMQGTGIVDPKSSGSKNMQGTATVDPKSSEFKARHLSFICRKLDSLDKTKAPNLFNPALLLFDTDLQASSRIRALFPVVVSKRHVSFENLCCTSAHLLITGAGESLELLVLPVCRGTYCTQIVNTGEVWLLPDWISDISSLKAVRSAITARNGGRVIDWFSLAAFAALLGSCTTPSDPRFWHSPLDLCAYTDILRSRDS